MTNLVVDPTPERVSACPVHFLWDGLGHGRALVRLGFLGLLVAAALGLLHLTTASFAVVAVSGAVYAVGQAITAWVRTRRRSPARSGL